MIRLLNCITNPRSCSRNNGHIHDLPVEILTEILFFCLPEDRLNHRQPDTTIAPMLLCQVCSNWRRIALNTPVLWVYLYLVCQVPRENSGFYTHNDCITPNHYCQFLAWWTKNSQFTPLVFRLEYNIINKGRRKHRRIQSRTWEESQLDPLFLLFNIISNTRGLYLDSYAYHVLRGQSSHCNLRCPNLRSLAMACPTINTESLLDIPTSRSVMLRHFICEVSRFSWEPQMLDDGVPWAYLTHISIRTPSISGAGWCTLIRRLDALQVGEFYAVLIITRDDTTTMYP